MGKLMASLTQSMGLGSFAPHVEGMTNNGLREIVNFLPLIGAGIGGMAGGSQGAIAGATAGSSISSAQAQSDANAANLAESQRNRDFQANMSNTSYQRVIEDMKKAGINPALAISQGGASTPSGSTSSVEPVDFGGGIPAAINAAVDMKAKQATIKKVESDTGLNTGVAAIQKAQATKMREETRITSAEATRAEQTSEFYKKHPWLIPLKETLGTTSSAMGQAAQGALILKALRPSSTTSTEDTPTNKDKETLWKSYNNRPKYLKRFQ